MRLSSRMFTAQHSELKMLALRLSKPFRAGDSMNRRMCSSSAIEKLKVTIPTTSSKEVEYEMPYIRTGKKGSLRIVAIHGTPGSLEDFRCLVGPLQRRVPNSEFISITLPDLNFTFQTEAFWHSAAEKQELMLKFFRSLYINDIDILIGHSAGMYPTLMTALYSSIKVKSLVTICGTGTEILPSLRPEWFHTKILLPLLRRRSTRSVGMTAFKGLMTLSGFRKMSVFDACSSLQTQFATRFWDEHNSPRWLRDLNERDLPRLLIYGAKDKLVPTKDSVHLSKCWGSSSVDSHFIYGGTNDGSLRLLQKGDPDTRCPVVVFTEGGHFTFMQFPDKVADHIVQLRKFIC